MGASSGNSSAHSPQYWGIFLNSLTCSLHCFITFKVYVLFSIQVDSVFLENEYIILRMWLFEMSSLPNKRVTFSFSCCWYLVLSNCGSWSHSAKLYCLMVPEAGHRGLEGLVFFAGRICSRPFFLACRWPFSPFVSSHCLPCVFIYLCIQISHFCKDTNTTSWGAAG